MGRGELEWLGIASRAAICPRDKQMGGDTHEVSGVVTLEMTRVGGGVGDKRLGMSRTRTRVLSASVF